MYRYQLMVNQFTQMAEFEGYELDLVTMKRFMFRKTTQGKTFLIEIGQGAFFLPKIYEIDANRKWNKKTVESVPKPVQETYEKVERILLDCNKRYHSIIPGTQDYKEHYQLTVTNLVETAQDHRYNLPYPEEIFVYVEVQKEKEWIGEVRFRLENFLKHSQPFPMWKLGGRKISGPLLQSVELNKLLEEKEQTILQELNKASRLHQLFMQKREG